MTIDHIFIFSKNQGKEGDLLLQHGFIEGPSRRHTGQGTINRKFYFNNFFLELLWVEDEAIIQRPPVDVTGLWERSRFFENDASRFGLCLVNNMYTDTLFKHCKRYFPKYFTEDKSIEFLDKYPSLPWTFRLPYRNAMPNNTEYCQVVSENLTHAQFKVSNKGIPINYGEAEEQFSFIDDSRSSLILTFDNNRTGNRLRMDSLDLTILY